MNVEDSKTAFQTEVQKQMHREFWELSQVMVDSSSKMLNLRKKFCNTLPFKVGDYVIFDSWMKRQGWITRMIMNEFFDHIYIYFNPPKKDGTPSKREELTSINVFSELKKVVISNPPTQ